MEAECWGVVNYCAVAFDLQGCPLSTLDGWYMPLFGLLHPTIHLCVSEPHIYSLIYLMFTTHSTEFKGHKESSPIYKHNVTWLCWLSFIWPSRSTLGPSLLTSKGWHVQCSLCPLAVNRIHPLWGTGRGHRQEENLPMEAIPFLLAPRLWPAACSNLPRKPFAFIYHKQPRKPVCHKSDLQEARLLSLVIIQEAKK